VNHNIIVIVCFKVLKTFFQELCVAIGAMTTAMLGPAFYYVPQWKNLQPVEDED